MPSDNDQPYTYNELSNEDKLLLRENGYLPGELEPREEQEMLRDLYADLDESSEGGENSATIGDEQDGTDSI